MAAEFGDVEIAVKFSSSDDGATFARVVAVVALAVEEGFDDFFDLISVRDFLEENDVRLEVLHGNDGVSIVGAVEGDDAENFAVGVFFGFVFFDGLET